jgi:hypothetical protein
VFIDNHSLNTSVTSLRKYVFVSYISEFFRSLIPFVQAASKEIRSLGVEKFRIVAVKECTSGVESLLLTCVQAAWRLCTGVYSYTREVLRKQQMLGRIA